MHEQKNTNGSSNRNLTRSSRGKKIIRIRQSLDAAPDLEHVLKVAIPDILVNVIATFGAINMARADQRKYNAQLIELPTTFGIRPR